MTKKELEQMNGCTETRKVMDWLERARELDADLETWKQVDDRLEAISSYMSVVTFYLERLTEPAQQLCGFVAGAVGDGEGDTFKYTNQWLQEHNPDNVADVIRNLVQDGIRCDRDLLQRFSKRADGCGDCCSCGEDIPAREIYRYLVGQMAHGDGCDGTLKHCREWLRKHKPDEEETVIRHLESIGCHCDCEVMLHFAEAEDKVLSLALASVSV